MLALRSLNRKRDFLVFSVRNFQISSCKLKKKVPVGGKTNKKSQKKDVVRKKIVYISLKQIQYGFIKNAFKNGVKILFVVHVATVAVFFLIFYFICKSDIDTIDILDYFYLVEELLQYMQNSTVGSFATTVFLMKISTPLRYFTSIATTFLITRFGKRHFKDEVQSSFYHVMMAPFYKMAHLVLRRHEEQKTVKTVNVSERHFIWRIFMRIFGRGGHELADDEPQIGRIRRMAQFFGLVKIKRRFRGERVVKPAGKIRKLAHFLGIYTIKEPQQQQVAVPVAPPVIKHGKLRRVLHFLRIYKIPDTEFGGIAYLEPKQGKIRKLATLIGISRRPPSLQVVPIAQQQIHQPPIGKLRKIAHYLRIYRIRDHAIPAPVAEVGKLRKIAHFLRIYRIKEPPREQMMIVPKVAMLPEWSEIGKFRKFAHYSRLRRIKESEYRTVPKRVGRLRRCGRFLYRQAKWILKRDNL